MTPAPRRTEIRLRTAALLEQSLPALLLALMLAAAATATSGQVRVEDLSFGASAIADQEAGGDLAARLAQAEDLFYSADQPQAIPVLSGIADELANRSPEELTAGERTLLVRALTLRAEARFNLGDPESARRDLGTALATQPELALDPKRVSPKFLALLEGLERTTIGEIELRITPSDARVLLDGRELDFSGPVARCLAGDYLARIERPGFAPVELALSVAAGDRTALEAELERTSAVLKVLTRPPGVDVRVDGEAAGATRAAEEGLSETLPIEVAELGPHELLFSKEGYRSRRAGVSIEALVDYTLAPIELEPARGTLRISGMSPDATLSIDGEMVAVATGRSGIELPPGDHLIVVDQRLVGRFERTVSITDQELASLTVELRPTVALLAVVAPSEGFVRAAHRDLTDALERLETWHFIDLSANGREILDRLGLTFGDEVAAPSWSRLQQALDREVAASLYAVAVVRPQGGPASPEIWLWSPAPDPPAPTRWRPEGAQRGGDALAAALDSPLRTSTTWLGASFLDSSIAAGPVVMRVTSESPATAAGLLIGDLVLAVAEAPVSSRAELIERLSALSPEAAVTLTIERRGQPTDLGLQPAPGPLMPWPVRSKNGAPIESAKLRSRLASGTARSWGAEDAPSWLLELHLAGLLLARDDGPSAARLLESITAPVGAGLGQGTVEYWLGVALSKAGRETEAQRAFEKAAAMRGARLHDHDGPSLAPRARARLLTP